MATVKRSHKLSKVVPLRQTDGGAFDLHVACCGAVASVAQSSILLGRRSAFTPPQCDHVLIIDSCGVRAQSVLGHVCMPSGLGSLLRYSELMQLGLKGTWCSGITSAPHAEGPGFKFQCVHAYQMNSPDVSMPSAWQPQSIDATPKTGQALL